MFKHYYHAVWRKNSTRESMNYRNIVEFVSISINLWPSAQCVCVRKCLYGLLWLKKSISISTVFSFRNKNNILYFGKTFVASNRTTRLYCRTLYVTDDYRIWKNIVYIVLETGVPVKDANSNFRITPQWIEFLFLLYVHVYILARPSVSIALCKIASFSIIIFTF